MLNQAVINTNTTVIYIPVISPPPSSAGGCQANLQYSAWMSLTCKFSGCPGLSVNTSVYTENMRTISSRFQLNESTRSETWYIIYIYIYSLYTGVRSCPVNWNNYGLEIMNYEKYSLLAITMAHHLALYTNFTLKFTMATTVAMNWLSLPRLRDRRSRSTKENLQNDTGQFTLHKIAVLHCTVYWNVPLLQLLRATIMLRYSLIAIHAFFDNSNPRQRSQYVT